MGRRSPLWVEAGYAPELHAAGSSGSVAPLESPKTPPAAPSSNDKNSSHTPKTGRGSPAMVAGG